MLETPEVTCPKCGLPIPVAPDDVAGPPPRDGVVRCPGCGKVTIRDAPRRG